MRTLMLSFLAVCSSCTHSTESSTPARTGHRFIPSALHFESVYLPNGGHYLLDLNEGGFLCITTVTAERFWTTNHKPRISPTPEEWEAFSKTLDLLDVWQWQPSYHTSALDGHRWKLSLSLNGKTIESRGFNSKPESWDELEKAIDLLTRGGWMRAFDPDPLRPGERIVLRDGCVLVVGRGIVKTDSCPKSVSHPEDGQQSLETPPETPPAFGEEP